MLDSSIQGLVFISISHALYYSSKIKSYPNISKSYGLLNLFSLFLTLSNDNII